MKENSFYLFLICIWLSICALAQCESAQSMHDIKMEISNVSHELNMLRWQSK